MRLPRHDTPQSLPAEHPREALARDEALLDAMSPGSPSPAGPLITISLSPTDPLVPGSAPPGDALADSLVGSAALVRWWVAASPAVVIGLGLRHRLASIVDLDRCAAAGLEILERRAGGGAVLVDEHMLCGAICLPRASVPDDVTESYRWLGDLLQANLHALGVASARRIEVAEARADVAQLKSHDDTVSRVLLSTCYGALSPHEIAIGTGKLVGIAQIRRRHAALFQFGILLRDQSPLADYLHVPDEPTREKLRDALRHRTIGLNSLLGGPLDLQLLMGTLRAPSGG